MIDRRRWAIAVLMNVLLAAFPPAEAQQPDKVWRVGYLGTRRASTPDQERLGEAFRQALRERGYIEGKNLVIEFRFSEGRIERCPDLAAELVRLKVDIIVGGGGCAGA